MCCVRVLLPDLSCGGEEGGRGRAGGRGRGGGRDNKEDNKTMRTIRQEQGRGRRERASGRIIEPRSRTRMKTRPIKTRIMIRKGTLTSAKRDEEGKNQRTEGNEMEEEEEKEEEMEEDD